MNFVATLPIYKLFVSRKKLAQWLELAESEALDPQEVRKQVYHSLTMLYYYNLHSCSHDLEMLIRYNGINPRSHALADAPGSSMPAGTTCITVVGALVESSRCMDELSNKDALTESAIDISIGDLGKRLRAHLLSLRYRRRRMDTRGPGLWLYFIMCQPILYIVEDRSYVLR
ncbi:hypothetical protein BKA82DRAFT_4363942 [Pisolithus tinctorius]|nr:hypothetical protein BKA82DRAFT_4363942 [Pisolithus tinctorius]